MAKKSPEKKGSSGAAKAAPKLPAPAKTSAAPDLEDVAVTAALELGRTTVTLDQALQMARHSLLELDRKVNDPVDVRINGKLVARGEVVTVSDNFGVRITEIVESE